MHAPNTPKNQRAIKESVRFMEQIKLASNARAPVKYPYRIFPRAFGDSFQLVPRFGRLLKHHEGCRRAVDDANVVRLSGESGGRENKMA